MLAHVGLAAGDGNDSVRRDRIPDAGIEIGGCGERLIGTEKAWITEQVPQCGYCQSGQIMQAAALLAKNTNPTKEEVVEHMDGNLCRCMTYSRIQKAIMRAASEMRTASNAGTERRPT